MVRIRSSSNTRPRARFRTGAPADPHVHERPAPEAPMSTSSTYDGVRVSSGLADLIEQVLTEGWTVAAETRRGISGLLATPPDKAKVAVFINEDGISPKHIANIRTKLRRSGMTDPKEWAKREKYLDTASADLGVTRTREPAGAVPLPTTIATPLTDGDPLTTSIGVDIVPLNTEDRITRAVKGQVKAVDALVEQIGGDPALSNLLMELNVTALKWYQDNEVARIAEDRTALDLAITSEAAAEAARAETATAIALNEQLIEQNEQLTKDLARVTTERDALLTAQRTLQSALRGLGLGAVEQ